MWSTLFAWLLVTVSLCIASEGDVVDVAGPEESDLLPNFEDARKEKDDSDAAVIQKVKNKHSSSHVRPHSVPGKDPSTSSQQNHPAKPSAGGATRETHQGKEVEKAPLIFAETNRNRVGWLMPDESIPE
ncbi:hypothetical protein GBAR_LOCUS837 [Geodia barretti]|uniref:Secreted protein n=1 Tax=Geodia barretti TaxID=519541 RepID=A0AA35W3Z7_GEOBA|nr:hypothetical protein GBAR_LOCUS837 [Geodia barretti]